MQLVHPPEQSEHPVQLVHPPVQLVHPPEQSVHPVEQQTSQRALQRAHLEHLLQMQRNSEHH